MRVRIDIGLDIDGLHTFSWEPTQHPSGVDIPKTTLERWTAEREAFRVAYLRWKRVSEEIEEALFRTEKARGAATSQPAQALAEAVAHKKAFNSR